ncbi:SPBc2 prophage-derived aminoglycoside N(3')-acetyltransferase-like protein YokD [compost metagenome]
MSDIFGEDSPVGKLYKLDGYVLLIGVGHDKNTSLHLAETRASFPSKRYENESSAMLVDGQRKWVTYRTQVVLDDDFIQLGCEFERDTQLEAHRVGQAEVRLMKQRALVDWAVQWMEKNRI